jgi:hypothetical protein
LRRAVDARRSGAVHWLLHWRHCRRCPHSRERGACVLQRLHPRLRLCLRLCILHAISFNAQSHSSVTAFEIQLSADNVGPAAARNVQIKLRSGAPEPKDANWTGDYPYAVYPVGTIKNDPGHIGSIGRQINTNDDERYEITCCWKAESGQFFTDINTKGGGHNNIHINSDERWKLSYEVTAENTSPIRFVLEIFIDDDEVTVAMVT